MPQLRFKVVVTNAAIAVAVLGCMVERVSVVVEATRVEEVSNHILFATVLGDSEPDRGVEVVAFDISSDVELKRYFEDRLIQVRCLVDGAGDSTGFGPYYRGTDLSTISSDALKGYQIAPRSSDGRYAYTVYAFANLAATRLVDSQFQSTPLEAMTFSRVSCFIVGVTKAPVLFPKSNEFILTRDQFQALVRVYRTRQASPNNALERNARPVASVR
jgi:hypothetical protein